MYINILDYYNIIIYFDDPISFEWLFKIPSVNYLFKKNKNKTNPMFDTFVCIMR